jgi:hypothetical protein
MPCCLAPIAVDQEQQQAAHAALPPACLQKLKGHDGNIANV